MTVIIIFSIIIMIVIIMMMIIIVVIIILRAKKIESVILPLSDSDRGRFCFRFFCAFCLKYD